MGLLLEQGLLRFKVKGLECEHCPYTSIAIKTKLDFDLMLAGEPYTALMLLLNLRNGTGP